MTMEVYGLKKGAEIYGLFFSVFTFGTILQFIIVLFLQPIIGFDKIFYIMIGISLISFVLLFFFKPVFTYKKSTNKYLKMNE